jgi:hypothetical protein
MKSRCRNLQTNPPALYQVSFQKFIYYFLKATWYNKDSIIQPTYYDSQRLGTYGNGERITRQNKRGKPKIG